MKNNKIMAGKVCESEFPLPKFRKNTYLTLEIMMYIDYLESYKFMFEVNKEAR